MPKKFTYIDSGVDIAEGERFAALIKPLVCATHDGNVVKSYGDFSAAYELPGTGSYLVAAADGVGTKLKIAFAAQKFDTVGIDLVAMCVNDLITCGAAPLFFLDYIATGHLEADKMAEVVRGISEGCIRAGCSLIGGETAEMPGFYAEKEFDLAGFAVGIVAKKNYISGEKVRPGDEIVSIPSSGLHSNGYSLVRRCLLESDGISPKISPEEFSISRPLTAELLEPTAIYAAPLKALLKKFEIHSVAHITGGGLFGNIARQFPAGCAATLGKSSWEMPAIFKLIQQSANLSDDEMSGIFNCGIGMTLVVSPADSSAVVSELEKNGTAGARVIGRIEKRSGGPSVRIV